MTEVININFARLKQTLAKLRIARPDGVVLTTDIIEDYMGGFHSNLGVPPADSWNAQFGKYLKFHDTELGIQEVEANVAVTINGHKTSSSKWQLSAVST